MKATLDALSERGGCYKQWDEYNMEAALQDLAEQCHVKSVGVKPNIRETARQWGVPYNTLNRFFHNPGVFDSGVVAGGKPVFTKAQEQEIVSKILDYHARGMALNHHQVKWLVMECIRRVPGLNKSTTAKKWLANGNPSYGWYRRFPHRYRDQIRDRVVENLDPKRWDVKEEQVKSLYDILAYLYKKYPDLHASNIANLDETNLIPERRKSKVMAAKGARRTPIINDQRFSMTMLPCVFANGEYMPPHFVVPGKIRPKWWTKDKELKQIMKTCFFNTRHYISVQENGWMNTLLLKAWF
eukprot:jgi/Tetstr1/448552/TSEL_035810.t1